MTRGTVATLALIAGAGVAAPAWSDRPMMTETVGGWENYDASHVRREIVCDGRPVLLMGNHTTLHLSGECQRVRVAGAHNDIAVDLAPGGMIEITGAHNDVTWRTTSPLPRPRLVNTGSRNTFHVARR